MRQVKWLPALMVIFFMLFSYAGMAHSRRGHYVHHHGHSHFGFYFGTPWYPRPYYPYFPYYPYYYPPQIITVPVEPPVYIERNAPSSRNYPAGYWYYCSDPEGYYPYVKECPSGWRQVDPTPSAPK